MAELIIQSGKLQGKRLILPDKEVVIGRDEDCHVRLSSSLVSRRHCTLQTSPEGLWVRDLASQNGTFVNDVPVVDSVLLKPGDILQVGATQFRVPPQKGVPQHETEKPKAADDNISDADIVNWLVDTNQGSPLKPSDTTIIKNAPPPVAAEEVTSVRPSPPTPIPATSPAEGVRRPPRSVKEQASEIIRKHWATVRGEGATSS